MAVEVTGTDALLDLHANECDVAIRCAEQGPTGFDTVELARGAFIPVCRPDLLPGGAGLEDPAQLKSHTLVNWYWRPDDETAPTWGRWLNELRRLDGNTPALTEMDQIAFQDELHALAAVLVGQGVALFCSVVIAAELASGALVQAFDHALPGAGYYLTHVPDHPRARLIREFSEWAQEGK